MACACGGGNKSHIKNARLAAATRVTPPAPLSAAASNNLSPGFGMAELPSPPVNEADRRRIQKLRQDAKIRALGKI